MTPIKVLVVDDHPVLREGIAAIIANHPDIVIVDEASDGREAIDKFRRHRPDVTLMDLQMPEIDGIQATHAIRQEFPDARIVILTIFKGDVQVARALEAGAYGYLLKTSLRKELLEAIRTVHEGRRRIPAQLALAVAEHRGGDTLTEREIEVLREVAAGNANKIIASHLAISEETVKGHVKNILGKLEASDRTHAVTIALKRGIITLGE
jgi:two-component system, NarL family, response regulator